MIALKFIKKNYLPYFYRKHFSSASPLSTAYNLYYNKFESYRISEHLSILTSIFVNIKNCDRDDINKIINNDAYVKKTIDYIIKHNTFDSTSKLLEIIFLYKIPLAGKKFFLLFNNLVSNFTIYNSSSSVYNNSIISLIYKSLKYRLEYIKNLDIAPIDDVCINQIYKYIKLYQFDITQLSHQTSLYQIDKIANCLFGTAHLLIKAGFDINYVTIFNLFFSIRSTFLSPDTLISVLYSLLDIKNEYTQLFTDINIALSYRLFMINKSQGDILLQLLYMHRLKQRSEKIQIGDNRIYLLPQVLRTRFEYYLRDEKISEIINPLSCIVKMFGYNKIIRKILLPKINKIDLKSLSSQQYTSLIDSLTKLNLSSSNKILSNNILITCTKHIKRSDNLIDVCKNFINVSKFLKRGKRTVLLRGLNTIYSHLEGSKISLEHANIVFLAIDKIPKFDDHEDILYNIIKKIIHHKEGENEHKLLNMPNAMISLRCISKCKKSDFELLDFIYKNILKNPKNRLSGEAIEIILKSFLRHNRISQPLLSMTLNNLEDDEKKVNSKIIAYLTSLSHVFETELKEQADGIIGTFSKRLCITPNKFL